MEETAVVEVTAAMTTMTMAAAAAATMVTVAMKGHITNPNMADIKQND